MKKDVWARRSNTGEQNFKYVCDQLRAEKVPEKEIVDFAYTYGYMGARQDSRSSGYILEQAAEKHGLRLED